MSVTSQPNLYFRAEEHSCPLLGTSPPVTKSWDAALVHHSPAATFRYEVGASESRSAGCQEGEHKCLPSRANWPVTSAWVKPHPISLAHPPLSLGNQGAARGPAQRALHVSKRRGLWMGHNWATLLLAVHATGTGNPGGQARQAGNHGGAFAGPGAEVGGEVPRSL